MLVAVIVPPVDEMRPAVVTTAQEFYYFSRAKICSLSKLSRFTDEISSSEILDISDWCEEFDSFFVSLKVFVLSMFIIIYGSKLLVD